MEAANFARAVDVMWLLATSSSELKLPQSFKTSQTEKWRITGKEFFSIRIRGKSVYEIERTRETVTNFRKNLSDLEKQDHSLMLMRSMGGP